MSSGGGAPAVSRALDRGAEAPRRELAALEPNGHLGVAAPPSWGEESSSPPPPSRSAPGCSSSASPHSEWAHCSCFSRPARDPSAGIERRCGSSACRRRPGVGRRSRLRVGQHTRARARSRAVEHFAANDGREGIARIGVAAFDDATALGRTASAAGSRGWSAVRVRAPRAWRGLAATARSLAREGRSASIRIWARMRPLLRRAWSACRAAFSAPHTSSPSSRARRGPDCRRTSPRVLVRIGRAGRRRCTRDHEHVGVESGRRLQGRAGTASRPPRIA